MAPISFCVQVAHVELVLKADFNAGYTSGNFSGDKGFATLRGFMIEQDAVAGKKTVGFSIVDAYPVSMKFGDAIGRPWIKWRGLFLRHFLYFTEQLRCGGLIEFRFFSNPNIRMASSNLRVPRASVSAVYSGVSKET
jgi:hypothetical protein